MEGNKIQFKDGNVIVPNDPIIPFIEGDGIGVDIWPASKLVLDSAVEKAYSGSKKIIWKEVLAGEKAYNNTGEWLPQETLDIFNEYLVGIKGPLTTPVGGGITSLNVALRQKLDLFAVFDLLDGLMALLLLLKILLPLIWLFLEKTLRIFMQE